MAKEETLSQTRWEVRTENSCFPDLQTYCDPWTPPPKRERETESRETERRLSQFPWLFPPIVVIKATIHWAHTVYLYAQHWSKQTAHIISFNLHLTCKSYQSQQLAELLDQLRCPTSECSFWYCVVPILGSFHAYLHGLKLKLLSDHILLQAFLIHCALTTFSKFFTLDPLQASAL